MDENSCNDINSQEDYCWYDYYKRELWNDIIPLVLTKKKKRMWGEDYAPIEMMKCCMYILGIRSC